MNMKEHILAALREQFECWEELLSTMSEEQITTPLPPSVLSINDEIAHLWAWQRRSFAWLEAARFYSEPVFPQWLTDVDPDASGNTDMVKAWIFDAYHHQPWSLVHQNWRDAYLHLLEFGEGISEMDLMDSDKYL